MNRFTKTNPVPGSDNLLCEAQGLDRLEEGLRAAGVDGVQVPARLGVTRERLTLARIDSRPATPEQLHRLGAALARLHSLPGMRWGLGQDNWIGLAPQRNGWDDDWGRFFVERRLQFQIARVRDDRLRQRFVEALDQHRDGLIQFLNAGAGSPALVHGDLWNGNVLFDDAQIWLIDPAVYYADPEVDLAMTEMFGGFGAPFLDGYGEVRRLSPEYPLKRRIYNLYHYLNHLNLFGSAYLSGCEEGLAAIDEAVHR